MLRNIFLATLALTVLMAASSYGQKPPPFKVLAFYTGRADAAHISFLREANQWFAAQSSSQGYTYESTADWGRMNSAALDSFDVVIFLDTRPEQEGQRKAFREYMEQGGAWMGFHFSAFALTPSAFNQDWDWYHEQFLGCGQYKSNTWRPTVAELRLENHGHPAVKDLPEKFQSAPNEWYRWEHDLRVNADIDILLAIDSSSFPLGTGPKPHEIWHEGYYPVAWTNRNYRMVYLNMGHNDMDYEGGTGRSLSSTFSSDMQNRFILNALVWLGRNRPVKK